MSEDVELTLDTTESTDSADDEQAKRGLPSLNDEMTPEEQQVVQQMATVDTLSDKYNGMCGRIVDVRYEEDADMSEEFRRAVQELNRKQQQAQNANLVNEDISEELVEAQENLRKMAGVDANEKRTILVTVQLPDGRTFTEAFDEPTFISPEMDNDWVTLYTDVLGLDPQREESIVGRAVPVDVSSERLSDYSIDLSRGRRVDADATETAKTVGMLDRFLSAAFNPQSDLFPVIWMALVILSSLVFAVAYSQGLLG